MHDPHKSENDILSEFTISLKNLIEKLFKQKILSVTLLKKYIKEEKIPLPIKKMIEHYISLLKKKEKQKKHSR